MTDTTAEASNEQQALEEQERKPFITKITVKGLRGFAEQTTFKLAVPNGSPGSGLTLIAGANNSGKSTVMEALNSASAQPNTKFSFTSGMRNMAAGDAVSIELTNTDGKKKTLASLNAGGSQATITGDDLEPAATKIFTLASRRRFEPYFNEHMLSKDQHVLQSKKMEPQRTGTTQMTARLFEIDGSQELKSGFNLILKRLLGYAPSWTIDQMDPGQHYVKFTSGSHTHSSDGLGEGILSLFFIGLAIFDSEPGSVVAVDEPELSLHPPVQRKLKTLLVEAAADRQIVISTHSPLFIDWQAIANGGSVIRVTKENHATKAYELSTETGQLISGFLNDLNNPHVLGLDANEVFFLDDRIIVLEGQEDVVHYPTVLEHLGMEFDGTFFGWGAGGADKIKIICSILQDLGFKKVVGIVDNDERSTLTALRAEFPSYYFEAIPADDVRFKPAVNARPEKQGLLKKDRSLNEVYRVDTSKVFQGVNGYLLKHANA